MGTCAGIIDECPDCGEERTLRLLVEENSATDARPVYTTDHVCPKLYSQCPICGEILSKGHACPCSLALQFGEDPDEVEVVDPDGQLEKFRPHEALMGAGLLAKRRTSSTPKAAQKRKAKMKRRAKRRRMK